LFIGVLPAKPENGLGTSNTYLFGKYNSDYTEIKGLYYHSNQAEKFIAKKEASRPNRSVTFALLSSPGRV
jgi:hypothetical protein